MSGANTQRAEDPADFGTDKRGIAARWIAELRLADKDAHKFLERGKKVVNRYLDERDSTNRGATRFNVFWSNVQTLKPAIYATPPKPVVQRRYLDQDPVARAASTILQRAIQTNIELTAWHEVTDQAVLDYLLPGRGTCWARYEPHFEDVQAGAVQDMETAEDGMQGPSDMPEAQVPAAPGLMPDADNEAGEGPEDDGLQITQDAEGQEVTYEEVCWDYVHWADFCHAPARVWQEVRWVARRVLMTREEGIERFGAIFKEVPLTWRPEGIDQDDMAYQLFERARVYEIWDKPSRKVYWICPDYGEAPLDVRDDPLKLNDFFPCPRPLYATLGNMSLMPSPDLKMYQDQADELDDMTNRIAKLADAVRATGVFNSAIPAIERIMEEGAENKLYAVDQWDIFSAQGGFKGAVDFLPLADMVVALKQLVEVREQTKGDLYEITGIADIVRGQGQASATATAERLKGQFAQLRLRDRVQSVARFCRDMVRITGEIIAKHFQPQTLLLLSDYQQTQGASPELAMQAIQLLKNDQTRGFRIEIEVDSTVIADQEAEQQARVAFLQMAGQFLAEAVPLAQQVPQLAPLAGQMLLFGVRGFPVGREMETVFETALEQLAQASQQPKPDAPPDPAIVKAQMDAQTSQQEMQLRAQEMQIKAQQEQAKQQQQAEVEAAKIQLEQARLELEDRKMALEEARMAQEKQRADNEFALQSRQADTVEREKRLEREYADVTAVQDAVAQMQAALDAVRAEAVQTRKIASAPKRVTIQRGPDGRAIGAEQVPMVEEMG